MTRWPFSSVAVRLRARLAMCSWFHVLPSAMEVRLAMPVIWYP